MATYSAPVTGNRCIILGDGDFSFSCDFLSLNHSDYSEVVTSTLESKEQVILKKRGKESIETIVKYQNASILFSLDATKLHECEKIRYAKFHRIIFNFPHVGGKSNIGANRRLLKEFFHSSARVLDKSGSIIVALCQGQGGTPGELIQREYNNTWKVVEMAALAELILIKLDPFSPSEFPNYSPTGFRSRDLKFHLERSLIHTFISHPDPLDTPSLSSLLEWKNVVPGCPYPLIQFGDTLIPYELKFRYMRNLWTVPSHPVQQVYSLITHSLDQQLACYGVTRCTRTSHSPLSPSQINALPLSPDNLDSLKREMFKCYLKSSDSQQVTEYFLTSSLFSHLQSLLTSVTTIESHKQGLVLMLGEVYRRCGISQLPTHQSVYNQLMLFAGSKPTESFSLRSILLQVLSDLLCLTERPTPSWGPWDSAQYADFLEQCQVLRSGDCVLATAGALKQDSFSSRGGDVVLIELDALALDVYRIADARVLWSRSDRVLSLFRNMPPLGKELPQWTPPTLHSLRLQHDLCFWHPWDREISELEVATAIQCYCGEYAMSASLFNEFVCPLNRLSHNYRLVLQSPDYCLSRSKAHRLQSFARELLRDFYGVELR